MWTVSLLEFTINTGQTKQQGTLCTFLILIEGKFNPGRYRGRQIGGGGIAGMYAKKPYMIPVNPHVTKEPIEKVVVGKQLSNVTDIEERAKSDLKDVIDDDKPHVPINIKGTKNDSQCKTSHWKSNIDTEEA